jgi:hypothetical protein
MCPYHELHTTTRRSANLWHTRYLSSSIKCRPPFHTLPNEQFPLWHILIRPFWIIQDTSLDNHSTWERFTGTEQRSTTVPAEMGGDLLAGISDLGDLLGLACIMLMKP